MFKSNGGMEPWRQWLLATGWDGLQKVRINKHTKEPLEPEDKHFINNWIDIKYEEVQQLRQRPNPHEFTMYYDA